MQCPKCGESSPDATVICPGCDYILDASFLGDDFLNEVSGQHPPVQYSSGSDAVVFGALDEPIDLMFSESTGSFLTADTQDVDRQVLRAVVYVGKSVQELMKPEAVLAQAADIEKRKGMLSAFELHVLSMIDGKRPVARLRKKTGLSSDDLRIAVGMLAEKNAVVLVGTIAPPDMKRLLDGELGDDDDDEVVAVNAGFLEEATLEATAEDMRLPAAAATKKSQELPKFKLDTMDIPDEAPGAKGAPSPWARDSAVSAPRPRADRAEVSPPLINAKRGIATRPAPRHVEESATKERAAGFFELAHMELGKGNRVRAQVYAKLAVETDPSDARYQELLKTWAVASRATMTLEASLFADADAAEKQGNQHKALALMVQALDANPNAAHIHNRLGLLLATRFKKFSEASDHLMKACQLEPNNVVYKNNLGKIIALADARSSQPMTGGKEKGFLGKLKKALE